jgi:hypothetical protein
MTRLLKTTACLSVSIVLILTALLVRSADVDRKKIESFPVQVDTTGSIPSDAVVLFDGTDLSKWRTADGQAVPWTIDDEGAMVATRENIYTREKFGDVQLHLEWTIPPGGNNGVKLHGWYEIQILDDHGKKPTKGSAGAVYKQHAPLVNACRKANEWQSYDIVFRAPRFDDDGSLVKHGRFTVHQNGVLIQDNVKIFGITNSSRKPTTEYERSILFTYHGAPARFRNVWARRLAPRTPDMD